jgi:hypothetical protein
MVAFQALLGDESSANAQQMCCQMNVASLSCTEVFWVKIKSVW